MAPMGGLDTLERLCKLSPRPPVVVISGAGEERLSRAAELGADLVVRKPFRKQVLLDLVARMSKPQP
jgi:FixJ family two-component response regulator